MISKKSGPIRTPKVCCGKRMRCVVGNWPKWYICDECGHKVDERGDLGNPLLDD